MELWQLYLLTRFDSFSGVSTFLSIFISIITVLMFIAVVGIFLDSNGDIENKNVKISFKYLKYSIISLFVSLFVGALIPSNKDVYMILGGYYATNNEQIKQLPDNVVGAINGFLQEYAPRMPAKPKEVPKPDNNT